MIFDEADATLGIEVEIDGRTTVMVGGIAQKPGVVEGRIEPREYLDLTLSFDHNIVDGAPAARFAQKFAELIESGYGLD